MFVAKPRLLRSRNGGQTDPKAIEPAAAAASSEPLRHCFVSCWSTTTKRTEDDGFPPQRQFAAIQDRPHPAFPPYATALSPLACLTTSKRPQRHLTVILPTV